MPKREEAPRLGAPSPIYSRSDGILAATRAPATVEPSWESQDFEEAYEDAFYDECWRKNRGGYRTDLERAQRERAEREARRLPIIFGVEEFVAWADDYRRERGERPALRAIERAGRAELHLRDACRAEGTTVRTARKYLLMFYRDQRWHRKGLREHERQKLDRLERIRRQSPWKITNALGETRVVERFYRDGSHACPFCGERGKLGCRNPVCDTRIDDNDVHPRR